MSDATDQAALRTSPPLGRVLEIALWLRVAAAVGVEWLARRRAPGRVCLFPDAEYYWALAGTICRGTPYEIVEWGDIPHFALRPPGYPLFLASCRAVLGDRPLGVRLAQALVGTLTVWLVYRLSGEVIGNDVRVRLGRSWSAPHLAAALAALHPYLIVMSALVLSEALFVPFMLAGLWGVAAIWNRFEAERGRRRSIIIAIAFGTGLACGAAVLIRPSWGLFVPFMLAGLAWRTSRGAGSIFSRVLRSSQAPAVMALGLVVVMGPWWLRNARVYGAFVPTALWMGASLYDGLNPDATGASDMRFLGDPEFWPLDEFDQDRTLTERAIQFARREPGRVIELAIIKLGRYWCPWPNAEGFRSIGLALAIGVVMVPLLAAMGAGLWRLRTDPRAWLLLAGPLLYFCAIHMVFASSMRYRIPAEAPAMGLAAIGLSETFRTRRGSDRETRAFL